MSTISYLMTVAASHFIVSTDNSSHSTLLTKAAVGSKKPHRLVTAANDGLPIFPVHPALITSTNDTTVFVFKGVAEKEKRWYLIENGASCKKQAHFTNDKRGTDHLNGSCVRLTFTLNAVGAMAAPFITVTGITECELPKHSCASGCRIVSVNGLCPGVSADPCNNSPGFVAFVRTEKGGVKNTTSEQKNYEW